MGAQEQMVLPGVDTPATARGYSAFISYSHHDATAGRWLHRRLEAYRLPRHVANNESSGRLAPIFRDREEFPAAGDLSAQVRAALVASAALVVVCTPAAAVSPWVTREITMFRTLHPDRPILAALFDGEPAAAFPAVLTASGIEPLAADFRSSGDGRRLALLKLVAGLSGVGVDALIQRDTQRRLRRVTAVTVAASIGLLGMTGLTVVALNARQNAERQRAAAEGLVEYMHTDLRRGLKGVGRLDLMTGVNRRAMDYYAGQDLDALPAASRERRARLLHAMGEDDEDRGNLRAATAEFAEARRTTASLLTAEPENPDRIFAHAQSEYWVGSIGFEQRDFVRAAAGYEAYAHLADRLRVVEPHRARSFQEVGYAAGNRCTLMLQVKVPAIDQCRRALDAMTTAAALMPGDPVAAGNVANRHAFLADAYGAAGRTDDEYHERLAEHAIVARLLAADPANADLRVQWIWSERAVARVDAKLGRTDEAHIRLAHAIQWLETLIRRDPDNRRIARELAPMRAAIAKLSSDPAERDTNATRSADKPNPAPQLIRQAGQQRPFTANLTQPSNRRAVD